jgi:hypothetical protein
MDLLDKSLFIFFLIFFLNFIKMPIIKKLLHILNNVKFVSFQIHQFIFKIILWTIQTSSSSFFKIAHNKCNLIFTFKHTLVPPSWHYVLNIDSCSNMHVCNQTKSHKVANENLKEHWNIIYHCIYYTQAYPIC